MRKLVIAYAVLAAAVAANADVSGIWRGKLTPPKDKPADFNTFAPDIVLELLANGKCKITFDNSEMAKQSGHEFPNRVFDGVWTQDKNVIKITALINGVKRPLSALQELIVATDEKQLTSKGSARTGTPDGRGGISDTNETKPLSYVFTRPKSEKKPG
ncbi:MAG: hypothetical protein WCK51_05165 [Armatimonadota bacterium]